jgi:hypothetical protein
LLASVYDVDESELFGDEVLSLSPDGDEDEMERRMLLQALALLGVSVPPATGALQSIQESVDRALGRSESDHLDDWEATLAEYGYAYLLRPPQRLLTDLAADLVAVRSIIARSQAEDPLYPGWCRVASGLSLLMAKTLSNLRQSRDARTWWNTAQHAADASGDTDLSLWVQGERLTHGLYEGNPAPILLQQANAAVGSASMTPCRGLVHTRAIRAQLLAMDGDGTEALHELHRCGEVFEQLPPNEVTSNVGSVLSGWAYERLHYTGAWVYAHLGQREQLDQAAATVRGLLSPAHHRMHAQINLLQAYGHIRIGDVSEGIRHAQTTYAAHPAEQRTVLVTSLADQVWKAVPLRRRGDPDVSDYRELLVVNSQRKEIT